MENNKPAYPTPMDIRDYNGNFDERFSGLSKREYMATSILTGLCANYLREGVTGWNITTYVKESVALTDELLNQLKNKK